MAAKKDEEEKEERKKERNKSGNVFPTQSRPNRMNQTLIAMTEYGGQYNRVEMQPTAEAQSCWVTFNAARSSSSAGNKRNKEEKWGENPEPKKKNKIQ